MCIAVFLCAYKGLPDDVRIPVLGLATALKMWRYLAHAIYFQIPHAFQAFGRFFEQAENFSNINQPVMIALNNQIILKVIMTIQIAMTIIA